MFNLFTVLSLVTIQITFICKRKVLDRSCLKIYNVYYTGIQIFQIFKSKPLFDIKNLSCDFFNQNWLNLGFFNF